MRLPEVGEEEEKRERERERLERKEAFFFLSLVLSSSLAALLLSLSRLYDERFIKKEGNLGNFGDRFGRFRDVTRFGGWVWIICSQILALCVWGCFAW